MKEISELTGLSDQTVRNLFRQYDKGGLSAIKPRTLGRKQGEKRHLTHKQEKELFSMLVDKNPEQLKLKGCLWTRDNVCVLIYRKYGIDMPIRTIGEYLKRWGLTVQRPAKKEMEQKPEQVEAWLNEQYPAIHNEAKAENAVIFWADETSVQNRANYARGYSPKGKTPILKVKAKKMHINMISTINNQGKLHFLLYSDAINSERLISFMEAIIKSNDGRKVYLILNNLRVHHSKAVSEWSDEHKEEIRLWINTNWIDSNYLIARVISHTLLCAGIIISVVRYCGQSQARVRLIVRAAAVLGAEFTNSADYLYNHKRPTNR